MAQPATLNWLLWDVSVDGFPPLPITATSRGKALADAWRQYLHYDDSTSFKQFLRMSRARRRESLPPDDGYGYVRRTYQVNPRIGLRARVVETGQTGVIVYPGGSTAHVRMVLDGAPHPTNVHPLNIEPIGADWL